MSQGMMNMSAHKVGQERLSTGSLLLLMHLAVRGREVTWTNLGTLRASYAITKRDLMPLIDAGWVESSANEKLGITDAGNEMIRNLLEWMQMVPKKGGVA